ncbi:MAG: TlpA disulfide reductase family protein [Methylophilaceae bacterium]|nr:TlpA disulfide reductase family protein [Methylophilaceae bacterium]MDG1821582.1 TlpA disulfide reductase family protein [Methylophilaceae bacterium]MDG2293487.1 TlpA disulfide reductase family protein [Methylophilaceae bacterium]
MMPILKKLTPFIAFLLLIAYLKYNPFQHTKIDDVVFTTIKGEEIRMVELRGKVVLVSFWATDCKSCVDEMPDLINTYRQYQSKGLEIIAVAMPYDPPAQVLNFVTQKSIPFPVVHDSYAHITQKFGGVSLTPTAYIYNKEGKRIQRAIGALNFNKLHALLDKELR